MTISTDDLGRITQQTAVVSSDGQRLGEVHQVYTSDTSGDPAWVTVHTGRFGSQESFVPLSDAAFDGDDINVAVTEDAVHGASRVDAGGHLSVEEEDDLYRYYGIANPDHSEDDVAAAAVGTEPTDEHDRTDGPGRGDASDRADQGSAAGGVPVEGTRADDYRAAESDDRSTPTAAGQTDGADDRSGGSEVAAGAGAAAGAAAAGAGRDRDDELADRDAEGRDEVVDAAPASTGDTEADNDAEPRRARDDGSGDSADGSDGGDGSDAVRPGERTTRLRRYVVTERVVQTIEELPDDDPR